MYIESQDASIVELTNENAALKNSLARCPSPPATAQNGGTGCRKQGADEREE
jgi:hypothetical protein